MITKTYDVIKDYKHVVGKKSQLKCNKTVRCRITVI